MRRLALTLLALIALTVLVVPDSAPAWSNGPDKNGIPGDGFGTHDWILHEAMHLAGADADWIVEEIAVLATDDPDTVFGDTVNHLFRPTGPYSRGAAQKVADVYHDLLVAYDAGDYATASSNLGWLSHYYSDILVPFHTSAYMEGADDDQHLSYELEVDAHHRAPGDNRGWITPRPHEAVTDIRAKTVAAAYFSRARYDSLVANYQVGASPTANATVATITQQVLSRAVNDLADIIRTVPTGTGRSAPGVLGASMSKTFPAQNSLVSAVATCVDGMGAPIEGARIEFTWKFATGDVATQSFTDPDGVAVSWLNIGNAKLDHIVEVTAKSASSGQVSSAKTWFKPTEVIGWIKTTHSNSRPGQNTLVTATTLVLNELGRPIAGLPVTFIWKHASGDIAHTVTTDTWGRARHERNIGAAKLEYRVHVRAETYSGGVSRSSTASFMPIVNPVAPAKFTPVSLAGANRFETAVAMSFRSFPNGADTVVVATGTNWPDALGGAALAGACDAPILLTNPNALPSEIAAEVKRLGASKAYVLGGKGAVSDSVLTALQKAGVKTITRLDGSDRYATARKIAQEAAKISQDGWDGTAFVATGANFPDALAASPLSAARRWPIYLADPAGSPSQLASLMKEDGVKHAIVLGGESVVSTKYESSLRDILGKASRLSGSDRYDSGVRIAAYGVESAGLMWDGVAVATGSSFPDALAGGGLGARRGSVMLLTDGRKLSSPVAGALSDNKAEIGTVYYLGGTAAVSTSVRDAVTRELR